MTKNQAFSFKNLISGFVALAASLFLILFITLAATNGLAGLVSGQFWTTFLVFLGVVTVFASFIETTFLPRLKKGGLLRTLFVYYALGMFLAVVLALVLVLMNASSLEAIIFFIMLSLYAWIFYVLTITAARPLYPVVHKLLFKQSI
jgi:hypothetical protein